MQKFLVALIPVALACGAHAQQELSIDRAVELAIKNNPRLSASLRSQAAAAYALKAARSLANPEIAFAPGITSLSGTGEDLIISQPLELNGTRAARAAIALARLHRKRAEGLLELRTLVYDTKVAYVALARAQGRRALAQALLAQAEEIDRITSLQVDAGSRPGIDLTQSAIELSRARQQVDLAEGEVQSLQAALNTYLGRNPEEPLPALSLPHTASSEMRGDVLVRKALESRPEIAMEEAEVRANQQEARLARAEGRPDLAPQIRIGSLVRGIPPASSGDGLGIGLRVSLPLLDHGALRNRVREAETVARAQADRVAAVRAEVRRDVVSALARLRTAEKVLLEYRSGVLDNAARLLEASRLGYEQGMTNILSVLEANRTYRSVQQDYLDARAAHAQALAELEFATGAFPANRLQEEF